jgi:hypothetical protein
MLQNMNHCHKVELILWGRVCSGEKFAKPGNPAQVFQLPGVVLGTVKIPARKTPMKLKQKPTVGASDVQQAPRGG